MVYYHTYHTLQILFQNLAHERLHERIKKVQLEN